MRLCKLCRKRPAIVPDRESGSSRRDDRLRGDLAGILKKPMRHARCGGGIARGNVPGYPPGLYKGLPFYTCSKCSAGWQMINGELVPMWDGRG